MNGSTTGNGLAGLSFIGLDLLADGRQGKRKQQGEVRMTEHTALIVRLPAKADEPRASQVRPAFAVDQVIDVLWGDQVQQDGNESCVFDPFVPAWPLVGGDRQPDDLASAEAVAWRMETQKEGLHFPREQFGDSGSKDTGKLAVEQFAEGMVEGLASRSVEVASEGVSVGFHLGSPFFSGEKWRCSTREVIS